MDDNITGIILAGGKSTRMGRDKSFILFSGRPLIEVVIDKISALCNDLIIVTNDPQPYEKYSLRVEIDILKDKGPLGGIYTGLMYSKDKYNFVVACDMPFLNHDLMQYMVKEADGYDVVIAENKNRLEPLCAVYSKNCIKRIEKEFSKGSLKITDFLKYVKVRTITEDETAEFDLDGRWFVNVNTLEDYRRLNHARV